MASTSSVMEVEISEEIEFGIGDGEGSFFGIKMAEGTKYHITLKANVCLSSFAIDPSTMDDDEHVSLWIKTDEEYALCSLTKKFPQYNAKFYFAKGSKFTMYLKGKGVGYMCGYKTAHAVYDSD